MSAPFVHLGPPEPFSPFVSDEEHGSYPEYSAVSWRIKTAAEIVEDIRSMFTALQQQANREVL